MEIETLYVDEGPEDRTLSQGNYKRILEMNEHNDMNLDKSLV